MIRLLALDLDGTLIDETLAISEEVRRAVAEARERGVTVTLATGRMFDATLPFARSLNVTAPLICYQGGFIQAVDADTPLYRATMDPALMRELLTWRAQRGWHGVLYADDAVFAAEQRYPKSFYYDLLGKRIYWIDQLTSALEKHEPMKYVFIADPSEADVIEAAMREHFGGRIEVVRSHAKFVEANPLGVSKGDALRRLSEHLGIPRAQVMAIGDQGNDVPMIEWAGVGVAMGSGSAEVKAVADWVAPTFAEDGAAVAIERFILAA